MLQNKKMDTNIIIYFVKSLHFILCGDFLFCNFKTSLNLLNKSIVVIFDIALFKNNGSNLMLRSQLLVISFLGIRIFSSLLRCISAFCYIILCVLPVLLIDLFIISHIKYSYSIIWVYVLSCPFRICKMLMRFPYILFWRQCKICCFNYISKDAIIQLVSYFFSVFKTKIISDEPRRKSHYFNKFVLKNQSLPS